MLEKMGWADGQGLGKDMQGDKTFVRVKKRENNLGLGQEATSCTKAGGPNGVANRVDAAAGMKGWKQTNDNFAGVLASLGATYGSEHKKKKKKRDKKKRKRAAENGGGDGDEESSGSDNGAGSAVAHAEVAFSSRKKHIRNKNLTRMSAHEISCLLGGAPSSTSAAATASRPKKKRKKDKKKKKSKDVEDVQLVDKEEVSASDPSSDEEAAKAEKKKAKKDKKDKKKDKKKAKKNKKNK